ncbi:phospholipid/cholesterol/gamma-HCH transport system substrate-binding protein [Thermomonospora echinospora]|uniref:Phospholipid/cholesterol/gamma-HCH transport system substrate-binding protein n=1 Tax=Thermomonospora echinospora TaxID=1992 RepID=A0A1H5XBX4_9ACTN|nr:MCE family protein [Thermomonospora echinospora]SEG08965.1 phospholipid/cholesterol/gamma-HCH transport system substrate-binding protein [Thermomonospora echinospora]
MREPRIAVNLAFFSLLGVVLAVWAVRSIISIDALERPFHVTADFATSPGLNSDLEVTHLGVRVGKVGAVRLRQGHVAVRLDLNRDARVPAGVGARVLRKSAVGEPYIELTQPSHPGTAVLKDGGHIPLARTAGTVDYQELFAGLSTTLRAVDPRDARTLVHEAATGLQGRGNSINDIIGDTHQLTRTLAANAGTLDALSVELTRLTATLSDHRYQLASGVNDLAVLTSSVRRSRADLDTVLEQGPGRLREANRLLRVARPGLGCLLTATGTQTRPLLTDANSAKIRHVLTMVPTLRALVGDITARDASGAYLRVTPVITLGGSQAAAEYTRPLPRPASPAVPLCSATEKTGKRAGASGKTPASARDTQRTTAGTADPTLSARPVNSTGDPSASSRWLPLVPPGIGVVVLLAVAARAVRLRVRTRR